ncbi:cytochrome c oxidase assembly protein [Arthrobacter sp. NPDC092385]|uniref:cytochrome c oxidase assembly protein n=1 Tax=Arthrobacter sp. NPDC092385 TaxID=3363943 RepID=UPI00381C8464
MTDHHTGGAGLAPEDLAGFTLGAVVVLVWLGLAVLYLLAVRAAALRGRSAWPVRRSVSWFAGVGLGLVAVGPLARAAGGSLSAHMAVHLVLGMLVPLLLVLGAPATLFLRAVPGAIGRRYSRVMGAAPVRVVAHPVTAALLATGPMALLYWDGTALGLLHHPVSGPLLHVHFVASGALFAYAVVGVDPNRHRAAVGLRATVIVATIAVHGVVAKHLYAVAGQGLPADTEQAAQLMYYGGDAVHALLLVVFCAQVYREGGRRLRHSGPPGTAAALPGPVV